jgi:uncharacterized integral membrane protein
VSRSPLVWFVIYLLAALLVAAFAPLEKTLGVNARIVYLHGAWVWAAMLAFLAAALAGLAGLIRRSAALHEWSRALGRTGLFFWICFLPMSLYVMQANWNGLYLDEPRFRVPLNLAIVGVLLQVGLSFIPDARWTSLANMAYAVALFVSLNSVQAVLHPESPIFRSDARDIQVFFLVLLILLALAAWQLARAWRQWQSKKDGR